MASEIILTRGLPASGKSTYAEAWVNEKSKERVRVNRDMLRMELFGYWYHPSSMPHGKQQEREFEVTHYQDETINEALKAGKDVIIDNTNLNPRVFQDFKKIWDKFPETNITHVDFPTHVEECIRRNSKRERKVPEHVIRSMAEKYTNGEGTKFHLFPNTYPVKPITYPTERKPAFGFDMDGTLVNVDSIRYYVNPDSRYKNFDAFHRSSYFSPANQNVVDILFEAVEKEFAIVIITGRSEKYRDITQAWLDEHDIPYDNIFMRKENDYRLDALVKNDIFKNINDYYDMAHFVDDRDDIAKVWENNGVQSSVIMPTEPESNNPIWEIINPFTTGKCLKCGRVLKNPNSFLGPECASK